jgi:hypothetical protein
MLVDPTEDREPVIERVCPEQIHPLKFLGLLNWIDGRPLLDVLPAFWQTLIAEALYTFRPDGSPQFNRTLWGMAKKNMKTLMLVLAGLYKLNAWQAAGQKGNQCYFVASDLGQANDDLDLAKKLIRHNPVLEQEVVLKQNVIERRDGHGFLEILPAGDAAGLHGKTFLWKGHDELHTQKNYDVLEALELDRTRPDAVASFASYASLSRQAGIPLVDMLRQHEAKTDPRLYVRWYSGTVEQANPALNTPLGPTRASIGDAELALPSWMYRRLCLNLPGQPDGAAFVADVIEAAMVKGRIVLPPQPGLSYVAFCDLSGGGADDATLAIAHHQEGVGVLDLLMDQGARTSRTFSPEATVRKFAEMLVQYGISSVTGDRYAAQWPVLAFEKHGIQYRPADLNRSQIYSALEPLLNSGRCELLDHPKLLAQLIGLVRKGEKIDHGSGEHDDHSNSAAGALVLVSRGDQVPWAFVSEGRRLGGAITEFVGSVAQSIGTALRTTDTMLTSAQRTFTEPSKPVRSLEQIERLDEGCREPAEQARLDEAYAKRAARHIPSAFEDYVRRHGVFFPEREAMPTADNAMLDRIREEFNRWK